CGRPPGRRAPSAWPPTPASSPYLRRNPAGWRGCRARVAARAPCVRPPSPPGPAAMPKKPEPGSKGCPYGGKPSHADHSPFCSRGCKDRDLLKWLGEGYRISAPPPAEGCLAGVDRQGDDG